MSPESAFALLDNIAKIRGGRDELLSPPQKELLQEKIAETRTKRANNSFKSLGMAIGEKCFFYRMTLFSPRFQIIKCNWNKIYSISPLAKKLLTEYKSWSRSTQVNGWRYFVKDSLVLSDLREAAENLAPDIQPWKKQKIHPEFSDMQWAAAGNASNGG